MSQALHLSEDERTLLVNLLMREREELPAEIHHTSTTAVRDDLRHRRELVRELLARLEAAAAAIA